MIMAMRYFRRTTFWAVAGAMTAMLGCAGLSGQAAAADQSQARWTVQPEWHRMHRVEMANRIAQRARALPRQEGDEAIVLEAEAVQGANYQTDGSGTSLASLLGGVTDDDAVGGYFADYMVSGHWSFDVSTAGDYRVWLRMWVPKVTGWNFHISFDEQEATEVRLGLRREALTAGEWFWVEGPAAELNKGSHRLYVNNLLGGKRLDRVVIQPADDPAPTGGGPEATRVSDAAVGLMVGRTLPLPDGVRWRVTDEAREAGLQFRTKQTDWIDPDGQWRTDAAWYRLQLKDRPVRIDHARIELDWPADRLAYVDAGAGQLVFDLPSGRLVGVVGSDTQIASLPDQPFFALRWWDEARENKLTSESEQWQWQAEASSDARWVYKHTVTGAVLTITPEPKDGELLLHATLENAGDELIGELAFPQLPTFTVPDGSSSKFAWPTQRASLISNPESHSGGENPYPRGSMNFLTYADDNTGIYLATYDPQARFNVHAFGSDRTSTGVNMSHTLVDEIKPGEIDERTVSIALLNGDWRAGSDLYRAWFYETHGKADLPRWLTHGVGWVGAFIHHDRPVAYHGDRDIEVDAPWWYGTDHYQIWGHGPILTCCPNYYYPDPGRGGEAEFKKYIQTLRRHGLRTGTYFHGHSLNPYFTVAEAFRGIDKDSLPAELQPPSYEWFKKYRHMGEPDAPAFEIDPEAVDIVENQGGGVETYGRFPRVFPDLNWGPEYRDYISFWVDRYLTEYETEIPYLDVWNFRPKHPEYNPQIGFGDGRQAERMKIFHDWMIERGSEVVGDDFAFTSEGYTDIWSLKGFGMISNFRRQPELIRYTFPDHVIVEGTNNGHWNAPDDVVALGRSFVEGNYLDTVMPRPWQSSFFWMKDALRFWIGDTRYQYTTGIVDAPEKWMVRHHLADDFALWLWFGFDQQAGALTLQTDAADRPIRWYAIDGNGHMRRVAGGADQATIEFEAGSFIGAVLAVWGDDLPADYVTFVSTHPDVEQVHQRVSAINVSRSAIELPITLRNFDGDAELGSETLAIAPDQSVEADLSVAVADRTIRTLVQVGAEDRPRRRLSPAPIDDPYLRHARRTAEQVEHPDESNGYALYDMVKRRIYWPPNVKGKVTIRYKQTDGSRIRVRLYNYQTSDNIAHATGDRQTQDEWLTLEVPFQTDQPWFELRVDGRANNNAGNFWVDRITVERDDS